VLELGEVRRCGWAKEAAAPVEDSGVMLPPKLLISCESCVTSSGGGGGSPSKYAFGTTTCSSSSPAAGANGAMDLPATAAQGSPAGDEGSRSSTSDKRTPYRVFAARGGAAAATPPLSARQMWRSLPVSCRVLVVMVLFEAAAWVVGTAVSGATDCRWGVAAASSTATSNGGCSVEHWQTMAATLVAQLAAAGLTAGGVAEESVHQMVSGTALSILSGIIWIAFEVSK